MEIQFSLPLHPARRGAPAESSASPKAAAAHGCIHKFALESRTRHTRRSSTRARTGCATCKYVNSYAFRSHAFMLRQSHRAAKRHVKCDETKPACLKCLKWRGYCDAYEEPSFPNPSSVSSSFSSSSKVPRSGTRSKNSHLVHAKNVPQIFTEPDIVTVRFVSSEQKAYFDEWTGLSMNFLSGSLDQSRLWTVTMPQVTMQETTLRFGAMAVGALWKAYETGSSPTAVTNENKHYLNAVIFYCEALRLQSKARPNRDGLRTALLSSLLFICFEIQRGNIPAALKHVFHGFSMLNELAASTDLAPRLVSIAQAPPSLVQDILECYKPLELQSRSFMGSYKKFFFPPTPAKLAGDVRPGSHSELATNPTKPPRHPAMTPSSSSQTTPASSSDALMVPEPAQIPPSQPAAPWQRPSPPSQAAASSAHSDMPSPQSQSSSHGTPPQQPSRPSPRPFAGIAPFTKHSPYFRPRRSNVSTLDDLPLVFQDLEQAQGYWSLVQKAMVSHIPMLTMISSKLGLTRVTSEAELDMKLSSVKENPQIGRFVAEARYWLSRWVDALEPVYQVICRNSANDPQTYLHALNLRVEYLVLYIYTTLPRFSGLVTAKELTPHYREINRLTETLLQARRNCGFAMDSGWTWPLFISSFGCRDRAVREDAIRILGQYPIRNALRDSRVFRAIAIRNQQVEEQVMAEGTEQEQWLRLRRRELVFEDFGTSVIYRSAQKSHGAGKWELVEEVAEFTISQDGALEWHRQPITLSASILSGVC